MRRLHKALQWAKVISNVTFESCSIYLLTRMPLNLPATSGGTFSFCFLYRPSGLSGDIAVLLRMLYANATSGPLSFFSFVSCLSFGKHHIKP